MANPYFNAVYYLANNPDVFAAGVTTATAWDHYVAYGAKEAYAAGGATRAPNAWFDAQFYLLNNQDLIPAGVTAETALDHFTNYGMYELRSPSQSVAAAPMTAESLVAYVNANDDIATAFGITVPATELTEAQQNQVISQYYANGYQENRPAAPVNVDPNPTETFTLTVGADTATANYFDGSLATLSGQVAQTLNSSDVLTGSGANASLKAVFNNSPAVVTPTLNNIQSIEVQNIGAAAAGQTLDLRNATGVNSLTNDSSVNGMAFRNVALAENMQVAVSQTNAATTVTFAGESLADESVVNVTLNNVGTATAVAAVTLNSETTGAIETVNLVSNGAADDTNFVTLTATGMTTLNVSGESRLNLGAVGGTALTELNAGEFANNLTASFGGGNKTITSGSGNDALTFTAAGNVTVATGEGDDRVAMNATLNAQDSLDGGEGRDTLQVSTGLGTVALDAANFEVLRIQAADAVATSAAGTGTVGTNTYDVERLTGSTIDTTVIKSTTAASTQTISNVASGHTLVLNGQDGLTVGATVNTEVANVTVNVKNATLAANTQDVLNINVGRVVGATAASDLGTTALGVGNITANGVETINVTSSGTNAANTINSVVSSTLTKLTITGDDALTITTAFTGTTLNNIDASAATGAVTLTSNVTTAPLAGSSVGLSVTGGTGNDVLAHTAANTTAVRIDGGAGDDTITGGAGADVLIGGSGSNIITGGLGVDSIDISGGAADTVILRGVVSTADRDVVTGFTTGTTTGAADIVSLANAEFTTANSNLQQVTAAAAPAANIVFDTSANGFLEVAFDQTGGTALGLDGTGLLANLVSGGGALRVAADTNEGYIVAYQDGKAYLYYAVEGADAGVDLAATDINLVGVFNGVAVGSFVSEYFLVAA